MTNRIMLLAEANENTVSVRTVSARMKSPQHFYFCYSEFDRLQQDGRIVTDDIRSFAKLRLDRGRDRITFDFTWLSGYGADRVEGAEQTVTLCWSKFQTFLNDCRQPDGPRKFKAISIVSHDRPKLVFTGGRENLRAAIAHPHIRHKLGKALATNFNWPCADEVRLANDFVPYSFFFQEFRNGRPCLCGGLILHSQEEDMGKAYYGIHT